MPSETVDNDRLEPAWKPRKVGRTNLACLRCRSRHAKCNGATPVCRRCKYVGEECVYDQLPKADDDFNQEETDAQDEEEYQMFKGLRSQIDAINNATTQLGLEMYKMQKGLSIAQVAAMEQLLFRPNARGLLEFTSGANHGSTNHTAEDNHNEKKDTEHLDWSISFQRGSMRIHTNIRNIQQLKEFLFLHSYNLSPVIPAPLPLRDNTVVRSTALWTPYGQKPMYQFIQLHNAIERKLRKRPDLPQQSTKFLQNYISSHERMLMNRILRTAFACASRHFGLVRQFWANYNAPSAPHSHTVLAYAMACRHTAHTFKHHSRDWQPRGISWTGDCETFTKVVGEYFFERARDLVSPYILDDGDDESGLMADEDIVQALIMLATYLNLNRRGEQAKIYHATAVRLAISLGFHTAARSLETLNTGKSSVSPRPTRHQLLLWAMLVHLDNREVWMGQSGYIPAEYRDEKAIGWYLLEQSSTDFFQDHTNGSPHSPDSGYAPLSPDSSAGYSRADNISFTELTERYQEGIFVSINHIGTEIAQKLWSADSTPMDFLREDVIHDFENRITKMQFNVPDSMSFLTLDTLPTRRARYNSLFVILCFPMTRLDLYKPILPSTDIPFDASTPFSRRAHAICTRSAAISTDIIALMQRNRGDAENGKICLLADPSTGDPDEEGMCHMFHLFELAQTCDVHIFNLKVGHKGGYVAAPEYGLDLATLGGGYLARARRIIMASREYRLSDTQAVEYIKFLDKTMEEFSVSVEADRWLPDPEDGLIRLMIKDEVGGKH